MVGEECVPEVDWNDNTEDEGIEEKYRKKVKWTDENETNEH